MNNVSRLQLIPALLMGLMALGSTTVHGQVDPFGGQQDPFNPGGAQQDPQPTTRAAPLDASTIEIVKDDPVVDAIVASDPQSAFDLIHAIDLLLNIDRDDLAKGYVQKLADLKLNDQQNYDLYKQAGSDVIFRIGNRPGLSPEGVALSRAVLDGADRYATDAGRISQLAESAVREEDKYKRSLALSELRFLGDVGAAVLLEKLVDPGYESHWPRIRQAVQLFGSSAEGPLMAALQSNSLKLRVEAIYLMGNLRSSDAVESLMASMLSSSSTDLQRKVARRSIQKMTGRVPDAGECETRLYRAATEYLMDQVVINQDANDLVKWWLWDAEGRTFMPTWLTSRTVARIRGFQRAKDLIGLSPENPDYERLYWVTRMETAKLTGGLERPLPTVVVNAFAEAIDKKMAVEVLDRALHLKRIPAAIAACEVIGALGHNEYLASKDGVASALVRALLFGSVRLTQAASDAIFKIDPYESFSGSSDYLASLVYLSRSTGSNTALIGHPSLETAQSFAVLTNRSGFIARPTTTSRELFEKAQDDPDLQLIVISDKLSQPGYSELVQAIRSSPRTSQIPVLLMVDPANMNTANRLAERYDNIRVSPAVANELVIARQIDNLMQNLNYRDATQVERGEFAGNALAQLNHYASQPQQYPFFDLVNHQDLLMAGLDSPSNAANTCRVLGELGTADAQITLLETASNMQLPMSLRVIATESFGNAVKKRGLMLSRQQILDQYDRYNASETESAENQKILGALLDAIEKRSGD